MAKPKTTEPKIVLEREYIVPLRRGWLKVPEYKRASKAVKTLKEFIARHMKVYDRDLRKIKVDILLNNEIRFRGMRKPLAFVNVKAKKFEDGIVRVELAKIPDKLKFKKSRDEKKAIEIKNKVEEKKKQRTPVEEPSSDEKDGEKEKSKEKVKVAGEEVKSEKHVSKDKGVQIQRKALAR